MYINIIRGIRCLHIYSPTRNFLIHPPSSTMTAEPRSKTVRILGMQPQSSISTNKAAETRKTPESKGTHQTKRKTPAPPATIPRHQLPEDNSVWDNAVLLIDKPKDWTSFDVCGKLRGLLAALLHRRGKDIKVGHAGTLDPMATGLLIVCVGKGTKSIDLFVNMTKEYSGTLRLGEATASYDAESEINETLPWEHVTDQQLQEARDASFMGDIEQIPPMYSALKVNGKKLYESARAGKEVDRKARSVAIRRFDLERRNDDRQNIDLYVTCSKGTYIRSLAHDLGKKVGSAAHLIALRREAIGEYSVKDAWHMDDLIEQLRIKRTSGQLQTTTAVGDDHGQDDDEMSRIKRTRIASDDEYSE